jgi:DNA mismatch endonuclease, patch repair protein
MKSASLSSPATKTSARMANIRQQNTGAEILLRQALHAIGLRFRIHDKALPGTPDLVLPRWRAVIFVHGCFWHRHPACPRTTTPSTNTQFWVTKFDANVARDRRKEAALRDAGWLVLVAWECEILKSPEATAKKLHALMLSWQALHRNL